MSTSIVEEKCLNNIINWLVYEDYHKDKTNGQCSRLLTRQGYNLARARYFNCQRLFEDMLNLNVQAVESLYARADNEFNCYRGGWINMINDSIKIRYPHDDEIYTIDNRFKFIPNPGICQALESMNVWLSVCMEGEPMESSKLYVTFEKMTDIIYHSFGAKIPGWGKECNEAVGS